MRSRRWLLVMVGILGLVAFGGTCRISSVPVDEAGTVEPDRPARPWEREEPVTSSAPELRRVGLSAGQTENDAFELHSYVLLTSDVRDPETDQDKETRERYERLLAAFIREVSALDEDDPAQQPLKATYVVTRERVKCWDISEGDRDRAQCVDSILDKYDYPRARDLVDIMRRAGKDTSGDGPYIVSTLVPLTPLVGADPSVVADTLSNQVVFQDLSAVPPHIVYLWFVEFLELTKREDSWETPVLRQLALDLRTQIGVLAEGLTSIHLALDDWIVGPG